MAWAGAGAEIMGKVGAAPENKQFRLHNTEINQNGIGSIEHEWNLTGVSDPDGSGFFGRSEL